MYVVCFYRANRSNFPFHTELGNTREIHDLHRRNIVKDLTLHSEYYSEIRGRKKRYLTKRSNPANLRPNCRNWAFVEQTKVIEKVIVPRGSLSVESIPVFRTVKYFNSI